MERTWERERGRPRGRTSIVVRIRFACFEDFRVRYERELRHGCVFVPAAQPKPVGSAVVVVLEPWPGATTITLPGEVTALAAGSTPGMRIRLSCDETARARLDETIALAPPPRPRRSDLVVLAVEARELLERRRDRDHYRLLRVARDAGGAEIRQAFLRLARRFHPDRYRRRASIELRLRLEEAYAYLVEAYEALRDRERRIAYDLAIGNLDGNRDGVTATEMQRRADEARKRSLHLRQLRCAERLFCQAGIELLGGKRNQAVTTLRLAVAVHPDTLELQSRLEARGRRGN